jgi:glycosyltransferase involved in cell wall biosynthesis
MIVDRVSGRLVPYDDDERLATVLNEVLADGPARRVLADRARAVVAEKFSTEQHVRKLEALYDRLLAPGRGHDGEQ